ncbi:MAG: peptidoglycan-associated lipoprotein Pal [Deltaproteobacteria bacterium]|nr:peptidoglycan-associated lipoprotein Pal [Deltaproteobacteria bacterium]MBI3296125.1 peptidoglycan-associated lipoprotein Pal [Deltaproteobacteria bacterium]
MSPDSSSGLAPGGVPVETDPMAAGGDTGLGDTGSEFKVAYFDYDSYSLRADAREALKANAAWLKRNKGVKVQVEGHCDERGTTEYNLALGERRANAARDFLTRLGVPKARLSVISYGEERPADPGHNDSAWSMNRRAVFVVLTR